MEVNIPKEISTEIEEASSILGLNKKEIVGRALVLYCDGIKKFLDLKKEFRIWDKISDECLVEFEKTL